MIKKMFHKLNLQKIYVKNVMWECKKRQYTCQYFYVLLYDFETHMTGFETKKTTCAKINDTEKVYKHH